MLSEPAGLLVFAIALVAWGFMLTLPDPDAEECRWLLEQVANEGGALSVADDRNESDAFQTAVANGYLSGGTWSASYLLTRKGRRFLARTPPRPRRQLAP